MPPIVSIVGKSKSGKTTLIEKLIAELKSRGHRVATIKHTPQGMSLGESDKDNWRHLRAGSEVSATSSPDKVVLIKPVAKELTIDEIAFLFGEDCDIILTEGFKQGNAPKIEVHRKEVGPALKALTKLIAIATDEPLDTEARQFSLEDIEGLANLLEAGFIKPQRERVSLFINNTPISLSAFPGEFIANTLLCMVSTLKGVGDVRNLTLFMKREPKSE